MKSKELLDSYRHLLPFLADVCGPDCEIVMHDLTSPDSSIIAIENPISGRKIGDPLTALAKEIVQEGLYSDKTYISNYNGKSKHHNFLSSTFFIKNENKIIGMICVNKNIAAAKKLTTSLNNLLKAYNLNMPSNNEITESFEDSVPDFMHARVAETIANYNIPIEQMSIDNKVSIVHNLNDSGILNIKGAIAELAEQLQVSVPTIYRYLSRN